MILKDERIRLSQSDLLTIIKSFKADFLSGDQLWLFGSRVDPKQKGGDIDLYIETFAKNIDDALNMKMRFFNDLQEEIGEQKIDIVMNMKNFPYVLAIHDVAKNEGIRIV